LDRNCQVLLIRELVAKQEKVENGRLDRLEEIPTSKSNTSNEILYKDPVSVEYEL
jgi:hypothetical protein